MPNICCFCVFECAGTDIMKMDKINEKTTKPSTRYGKSVKAGAREDFIIKDPQESLIGMKGPWKHFSNLATLFYKYGLFNFT